MKTTRRERRSLRACGALLLLAQAAPVHAGEAETPVLPPALERVLDGLAAPPSASERARLAELFQGWDGLLAYLPLQDLANVELAAGWIDLGFDFGKDAAREIEIPAERRLYWDAKRRRTVSKKSSSERLRLRSQVRILLAAGTIRGLRVGDLAVHRSWLGWFDLDVRFARERRLDQDSLGRPRVVTDARGEPRLRAGEPVLLECDRWLVLTACGQRVEVPLTDAMEPVDERVEDAPRARPRR